MLFSNIGNVRCWRY